MGQQRSKILHVEDVVSIRDFFDDLPDSRSSINPSIHLETSSLSVCNTSDHRLEEFSRNAERTVWQILRLQISMTQIDNMLSEVGGTKESQISYNAASHLL
jgi:hypothetical protein